MKNNYNYSIRGGETSTVVDKKKSDFNPETSTRQNRANKQLELTETKCDSNYNSQLIDVAKFSGAEEKQDEKYTASRCLSPDYKIHYAEIEKSLIEEVKTENTEYKKQLENLAHVININSIPILILGETGVGKSFLAKIIFNHSMRKKSKKFLDMDCTNFSDELLTSDLFGFEKGNHSTAFEKKIGKIESHNGGIIFFDEIDKANKKSRQKLLKLLDTNNFYRSGGNEVINVDVRFIFGSNQDLTSLTENGLFEREFYERIAGFVFRIPPLRERTEDLKGLVEFKCSKISEEESKRLTEEFNEDIKIEFRINDDACQNLRKYSWTSNTRELFNYISRLYVICLKENTFTVTRELIQKYPPGNNFKKNKNSLLKVRSELKEMFIDWYQTEYLHSDEKISNNITNSNIKPGFLQKKINPILAHIYESINPDELGLSKTDKDKMARKLIGIGGNPSGKQKSTLSKYLEEYDSLIKQQE